MYQVSSIKYFYALDINGIKFENLMSSRTVPLYITNHMLVQLKTLHKICSKSMRRSKILYLPSVAARCRISELLVTLDHRKELTPLMSISVQNMASTAVLAELFVGNG